MRAPFQVLIFPFIKDQGEYYYCLLRRADLNIWQAIAGGGEDLETPLEAAKRESFEEASINPDSNFIRLSSMTTIPAVNIKGLLWNDIIMIPEIAFAVELESRDIAISKEHAEYQWDIYEKTKAKLKYDSNKSALWELDYRLKNGLRNVENNRQNVIKYYFY